MSHLLSADPSADILSTTDTQRARHGCGAYPYDKGTLLGVLAAAVQVTRIIEVGTAFGYSAVSYLNRSTAARAVIIATPSTLPRLNKYFLSPLTRPSAWAASAVARI